MVFTHHRHVINVARSALGDQGLYLTHCEIAHPQYSFQARNRS